MGVARSPRPVNLICGLISNDPDLMKRAIKLLCEYFGAADEVTELYPFDDTDYYALEMGEDLQRQFVSFEQAVDPVQLAAVKVLTNQMERRLAEEDDDCHAILQLAAACRGALNSLTIEIIEGHIRHHVVNPDDNPRGGQAVAARQLLEVLRAYMR